MTIPVTCECGHELSVSDGMAGRKGRCPDCSAVIEIPGTGKPGRGGAYSRLPEGGRSRGFGWLSGVAWLFIALAFSSLLLFVGIGVYTGVTAFQNPETFRGPFGLFASLGDTVGEHAHLMGVVFILGGIIAGSLSFLVLAAVGQAFRLFISLEHSLGEIAEQLGGR